MGGMELGAGSRSDRGRDVLTALQEKISSLESQLEQVNERLDTLSMYAPAAQATHSRFTKPYFAQKAEPFTPVASESFRKRQLGSTYLKKDRRNFG